MALPPSNIRLSNGRSRSVVPVAIVFGAAGGEGGTGDASLAEQEAQTALLTTIAGYVDGLEALAALLNGYVDGLEALTTAMSAKLPASLGPKSGTTSLSVTPSADQDPIFDHANGTKNSVTVSATIVTPPAGCTYIRISTDVDIFVNTENGTAIDDGTSIQIKANQPEIIPVTPALAVKALSSSGTAVVRCTPMKAR